MATSKQSFATWTDVKREAKELSMKFGFAWIVGADGDFGVVVGELAEEMEGFPFLGEFKDGVEQ